jgi:hypothetical protein
MRQRNVRPVNAEAGDQLTEILSRPAHKFERSKLKAHGTPAADDNGRQAIIKALSRINRMCSTEYAIAIESGRIFSEGEVIKLASLEPVYLAGACLAEVYDSEALSAFAKAPKTNEEMLELRHKQRIAAGGYRGEAKL